MLVGVSVKVTTLSDCRPHRRVQNPRCRTAFCSARRRGPRSRHAAPVSAKIEAVTHGWLEVVLHQPLLDQVWLRERAPDLFRRIRDLTFDNDGARFGRRFRSLVHPFQQVFEVVEPALPEPGHLACPVDQRGQARRAARYSASGDLRGGRAPARPASGPRDALRRPVARPRPEPSGPRPSSLLRGTIARRWPAESDRRAF